MSVDPAEFNEHVIASGTAELAQHRRPLPDVQRHLNSDGEVCDCGETPPQPGLVHYRRNVGVQPAAVAYTPPKYGPPPGVNPVKWRAMSRADRRAHLRELARTLNHVARQPEPEQ